MLYAVQMLFFGLALLIAARPGLDNPGCYRDGWDIFRGICEGMALIFFLGSLLLNTTALVSGIWHCYGMLPHGICSIYSCMPYVGALFKYVRIYRMKVWYRFYINAVIAGMPMCGLLTVHRVTFLFCSVRKSYLNYLSIFLDLLATILPLLIIPFRAATTWCASTGDGYCVDPTLLQNTSNATSSILDINQACITASSVQWIIASLAYMVNAIQVVRYLSPFR